MKAHARDALTLTHIPQPIHRLSEIVAILSADVTSIHSFPEIARSYAE